MHKGLLTSIVETRQRRIANMTSIAGRSVITQNATLGAAKHGMVVLTRALRYAPDQSD